LEYKAKVFQHLGKLVARRPAAIVLAWLAAGIALFAVDSKLANRKTGEPTSFLPAGSEQQRALTLMSRAFPTLAARSQVAVVTCRPSGLQPEDMKYLNELAIAVQQYAAAHKLRWSVLSPAGEYLRQRLVSADHEAALLIVNLPSFYVNTAAAEATNAVEKLSQTNRPAGLEVELSGTAAAGRDYGNATKRGVRRTLWVTILCVVVILLLVYRSPVAAAIPIIGIGICTTMALHTLDLLAILGWSFSDLERMFTVVLLYGAGTDFAMFWLARYREERDRFGRADGRAAAAEATCRVGPAIVASSATTILGLLSLITTDMVPTHSAGKVLGVVLCWAPIAGVTLIPAMVCLTGRTTFWPSRHVAVTTLGQRRLWPHLAAIVVRRPATVLIAGIAILAPAAVHSAFIRFQYDALSELPPGSSSERGAVIAEQHFPPGALYPVTLLVHEERGGAGVAAMRAVGARITTAIARVHGVEDVYDLSHPFGLQAKPIEGLKGVLLNAAAEPFYISPQTRTIRLELMLRGGPFSLDAMHAFQEVRAAADRIAQSDTSGFGPQTQVLALGATPYIVEVRKYMTRDEWRVWIGATVVIWLVLTILVRRIGLSLFMVAATLLTYAATLGISHEFFTRVLGAEGLDYKVKLFLFVIIVAVGQDYNIFLITRLRQEADEYGDEEGTQRAIIHTGSVISNCGLIMAATLGSLGAGGLELLRQLGFALALGMLIDTFVARPLLMPSFWLCARRIRGRNARRREQNGDATGTVACKTGK
jgi:RND superfamily putative drug exporter